MPLLKCLPFLLRAISISEFMGPSTSSLNTRLVHSLSPFSSPVFCSKYWQLTHYCSLCDIFAFTIVAVVEHVPSSMIEKLRQKSNKNINEKTTRFMATPQFIFFLELIERSSRTNNKPMRKNWNAFLINIWNFKSRFETLIGHMDDGAH